jgi:Mg-chelatase subunit ChlD
MHPSLKAALLAVVLILSLAGAASAQAGRKRQVTVDSQKKSQRDENPPSNEQKNEQPDNQQNVDDSNQQDVETVKIETNLVTVPVIVSDRSDKYLSDLRKEDFTVLEDGVKQEISFFETVTAPFNVVLMLDTSASTQEKQGQIQQAAIEFTNQLQPSDRVKVISFDDQIHDLCNFTSDRAVIRGAIRDTRPGQGTKLYDAMRFALNALQRIQGRKAIVIFTDGVDSYSDRETYDRNVRMIEEAGIIIYPIRYDTREDVERLVRQQEQAGRTIDLGSILGGIPGTGSTTPTTYPGGGQTPVPTGRTGGGVGTSLPGLPGGIVIGRSTTNGRNNRYPPNDPNDPNNPNNYPSNSPGSRYPNGTTYPNGTGYPRNVPNDSIEAELDMMYRTADAYLGEIANKSGGQLYRADTLVSLPRAFAQIAAELRTQYSLGYYPPKATARDGKYHKIKVSTMRKDVSVRARPGYRAPNGMQN